MAEFEERKKFWRIFYSPLVFIILLVAFLFMARALWRVYTHERVSTQDRNRLENELATVSVRATVLKNQVEALQTPQGVEDEIRSKFNVTKVGEGVAVIVNGTNTMSATTTSVATKSWWQKFVGILGL
jgi:cell division protein FtsB